MLKNTNSPWHLQNKLLRLSMLLMAAVSLFPSVCVSTHVKHQNAIKTTFMWHLENKLGRLSITKNYNIV
jgi:hypothetical protein